MFASCERIGLQLNGLRDRRPQEPQIQRFVRKCPSPVAPTCKPLPHNKLRQGFFRAIVTRKSTKSKNELARRVKQAIAPASGSTNFLRMTASDFGRLSWSAYIGGASCWERGLWARKWHGQMFVYRFPQVTQRVACGVRNGLLHDEHGGPYRRMRWCHSMLAFVSRTPVICS